MKRLILLTTLTLFSCYESTGLHSEGGPTPTGPWPDVREGFWEEFGRDQIDLEGYALYFSRSPIPFPRGTGGVAYKRHIGVYGYQRHALLEIASREPTALELAESLEQLRMLEHGFRIRVLATDHAWPGVDTMNDLEELEGLLRERPELAEL